MKRFTTLLLASLASISAAQETTTKIDVIVPWLGNTSYQASVKDVNPEATTYILGCRSACVGRATLYAEQFMGITVIEGPSTVAVHHTFTARDESIGFEGSTSGDALVYQEVQTVSGRTLKLAVMNVAKSDFVAVLNVTAGVEKLAAAAAATTTSEGATEAATQQASSTGAGTASRTGAGSPTSTPNAASSGRGSVLAGLVGAVAVAGAVAL